MSELDEPDAAEASDPVESGQHGAVARDANVETEAEKYRLLVAEYEAKIEEVSAVIARVRHEINNPLTGVLGQAQLLLREDLNDKARKRAETIEQLAARLRDIVAQLRHVQKPPNS